MSEVADKTEVKCCGKPLEFKLHKGHHWQAYIPETAECRDCRSYFERKPGNQSAYRQRGNSYYCTGCGSEIRVAEVAHPVWENSNDCAGSGNVLNERVPYCPMCEEKPSAEGEIILRSAAAN